MDFELLLLCREEEPDNSFEYFSINNTPAQCMTSMSASLANEMFPLPRGWQPKLLADMKYVDDFLRYVKICTAMAKTFTTAKSHSLLQAKACQDFFVTVRDNANHIGMTVNSSKTQIICIMAAHDSVVESFINVHDTQVITLSQENLKILGFTFNSRLGVGEHIDVLVSIFCNWIWFIRHLRRAGVPDQDLAMLFF